MAIGGEGGSGPLNCKTAAALMAVKAVKTSQNHHASRDNFAIRDKSLTATRGGVIARVWISMRQKSNRPLRSMAALPA
jgi:hypothetical protein